MSYKFLLLIASVFLSFTMGCVSVGIPQYDAIAQRITPIETALDNYTWQLSFGDYQTEVLAVTLDNGTGFTSQSGDALLFDGANVTYIPSIATQSNVIRLNSIDATHLQFEVRVDGQRFEMISCEPPIKTVQQNSLTRCQGEFVYSTQLTYQNGQIIKIEQDIPFYNKRLTLSKY